MHAPVTQAVYVTGAKVSRWQHPESNTEYFWYNYTIINCLLTIFVHNYYAQPLYYTRVSKWCESLTDWSNPLTRHAVFQKNDPTQRRNEATAATAVRRRRRSCACPARPTWSCPATRPGDNSRSSSPTHATDGLTSSAGNYTKVRGRGQTTVLYRQPRSVFITQNIGGGDVV